MYLLWCEQHQSLDQSVFQRCLNRLDPLEYKQLLKALDLLEPDERIEIKIFNMLLKLREYKSLLLRLFLCLLSIIYLSEADPQLGFRNRLLDGWWLEFWETILLAAGDVERNPGPRRMIGMTKVTETLTSTVYDNNYYYYFQMKSFARLTIKFLVRKAHSVPSTLTCTYLNVQSNAHNT